MCGIAGIWRAPADGTTTAAAGIVDDMLHRLVHRGPDAAGTHAADGRVLGHRRLSIVDLDGGDQPIVHDDAALVANGEIYNAPALREQLDRSFTSGSDNEVIVHLLAEHGPSAVERLSGMYAFAVAFDDELLLGRDPLGIKPLYVGRLDGSLVFASELRAFPAGSTDVRPFPPGVLWSTRTGAHRFWNVPDPTPVSGDMDLHAARLREALDASVASHLMADVPVGAFLSGGLDSSAIVALLRRHVDELHTFSVGVPGSPDLAAARVVADHVGTVHHEYLLDPAEIVAALPDVVRALESFDQDLVRSAVPTWFTARLAAEHVKVVLTGEGADELFAGYAYHKELTSDDEIHADARRSLAELHHVNLQRVDRLTMAHSLEARVPFLDTAFVDAALAVPARLRRPDTGPVEKTVLRAAVADLLPTEILWRDKAQFDEGSGTATLLPELATGLTGGEADSIRARHPHLTLRSDEECWYLRLLVDAVESPESVLGNVARWSDR